MACPKSVGAQPRSRGQSIDAAFLFSRKLSLNSEMQSLTRPGVSGEELSKLLKRLRQKSCAADSNRKSSPNADDKRAVFSREIRDRRSSLSPRYNGYQLDSRKVGQWDVKASVLKRWLKEYERKQADRRKERQKKLKPLDRFRRAVKLIQTCSKAFRCIVHYAMEKGQHEQVQSDVTVSLKTATAKGAVENLMFDPERYKCHHEFVMPLWAKEIASKEPSSRTPQESHSIMQLMKQLKGFRRYSFKMQEAVCKALKYDCFGRRRVVIRKGHVAQRFYFIFSGSVCVTADDDQHSAFAKPTDNAVLKRGDYFGELAFIRGIERSATVVCLERTELLSVEKQDFFSAKIDQCFNADMQRRVEYLKEHQVFSTWPDDVVRKVAEESRLQDYNSDEVIVRDSSDLHWIIFITKGQCDVLRLLDLGNCKDYIEHAAKYRMDKIKDDTPATYRPKANDISLSSIVLQRFTPGSTSLEYHLATASTEKKSASCVDAQAESRQVNSAEKSAEKALVKGILHSEKSKGKLRKGHVSFRVEGQEDFNNKMEQSASSEPLRVPDFTHKEKDMGVDKGLVEERVDGNVGVGVYMMVDRLRPGQVFGSWCLLDQDDACIIPIPPLQHVRGNPYQLQNDSSNKLLNKKKKPKERRFILVSGGCEVIKVAKDFFHKYSDEATIEKLRKLTTTYPRDSTLCRSYLQQSDWRTYREEIVDNVVIRHIARLETAKGSARSHNVRSSPVPSPLCSMKMWPSVKSEWEYFPDTGWVMGHVTRPVVEAGTSRPSSATKRDHSNGSPAKQNIATPRRCSAPPFRKSRGSSGTNRRFSGTTHASSGTSLRSSLNPRVSSGPPRLSSAGVHRGSPVSFSSSTTMSAEKLLPLVTNDLVLAQGSQRTLVLTQGGSRCNDYQLQIERNIINKYDLKKACI